MPGKDDEPLQDDFAVEVTDIDESGKALNGHSHAVTSSQAPDSSLRPRLARHRRIAGLVVTAGVVVLAALIILGSTASVRTFVIDHLVPPPATATPVLGPGADLFYIQGDPLWGHALIDGHALARLPIIGVDPPLRLSRGQHVVTWQAPPFLPLTCVVSVPADFATDTCDDSGTARVGSELFAAIITFSESLDTLSSTQRAALIRAVQQGLDTQQSSDIVRPGELYVFSTACGNESTPVPACYRTAKQPLRAVLSFHLDTDAAANAPCNSPQTPCAFSFQNCHLFCPGAATRAPFSPAPQVKAWDVAAPVRPAWNFTTLDGRVVAQNQSDNTLWDYATGNPVDEYLIELQITWDSRGWHVVIPSLAETSASIFGAPKITCAAAQNEVGFLGDAKYNNTFISPQWNFVPDPTLATGCLVVTNLAESAGTPTSASSPSSEVAICLHRFGVLLAANALAHRLWPYLPLADAYEQGLAQELAQRAGY